MNEIKTLIDIMLDTLQQKYTAMTLINEMTMKQTDGINESSYNEANMSTLVAMKQTQIDKIRLLDDGFVSSYERVEIHFNHQPDLYRDAIIKMKALIKNIGETGISIQVNEMRNKRLLDIKKTNQKLGVENGVTASKQLAKQRVDAYSKYKKPETE